MLISSTSYKAFDKFQYNPAAYGQSLSEPVLNRISDISSFTSDDTHHNFPQDGGNHTAGEEITNTAEEG